MAPSQPKIRNRRQLMKNRTKERTLQTKVVKKIITARGIANSVNKIGRTRKEVVAGRENNSTLTRTKSKDISLRESVELLFPTRKNVTLWKSAHWKSVKYLQISRQSKSWRKNALVARAKLLISIPYMA